MEDRGTSWLFRALTSVAFGYFLLRPVGHGEILYPLLALIAVSSVVALIVGRRRVSFEVVSVIGLVMVVGLYGTVIGVDNPGMSQNALVWLGAPLIFGAWVLAADERMLRSVLTTAAWCTIALSALIVLFVGTQLGVIPQIVPQWLVEETGAGFAFEDETTAIRLYGLSTLVAAAPMWITAALLPDHPLLPPRAVRVIAAVIAASAAMLGGRNAIVLVVLAVPAVMLVWRAMRRRSTRVHPGAVLTGLLLLAVGPFLIQAVAGNAVVQRTVQNVLAFFEDGGDQSIRVEQAARLLDAWQEAPYFGHGWGATIEGYYRSQERPWNFELQYHLLLFQVGLVGMLIVGAVVVLAVRAIARAVKVRPDLVSIFLVTSAGALGMLIGNATNPYLQAPGHMWAVWLPLMVANVALCNPRHLMTREPTVPSARVSNLR
ncbi:hypothetical protein DCE93_11990 [Agromyces badenianii]|uniref:O-antigen ligase-related domain-containing protein n=1 Tax=Agromyces badenianii TaxID=2080742 RepID=A0A2S0WYA2_9MICO|nr:O-antigen ligase family protein [Agromyces badenianii]AWB96281.1 hypothetical protein DCE93_11990 [Agromyces badenianii]